jgi:hypothetical protein
MDETPGFVATIKDAPAPAFAEPARLVAPTQEIPALAPERAAASANTLSPPRRGRGRGRGRSSRPPRVMSRVLLLAIAAGIALYAGGVGSELLGLIRSGASARTVPVEGGSLLRARALEVALHGLPRGRIEALRVAADRIDARVAVGDRVRLVRITQRGWVADVPAPEKPSGHWVRVDPRAPARILRTVSRRAPAEAAYLLLDGARWQLVLTNGRQYSADAHGRTVRAG